MKKGPQGKDPAAVALGSRGGKKSRAYMSPEKATELGRHAVSKRKDRKKKEDVKSKNR